MRVNFLREVDILNGMIPIVPKTLIKEYVAKHTEQERRYILSNHDGDFLLRDINLTNQRIVIIPPHFQRPEITITLWEHFKSTIEQPMTYLVRGLAVDVDRLERFVLYFPLYEQGRKLLQQQEVDFLVRPEEMFFSGVCRDGYNGPRFRRIG